MTEEPLAGAPGAASGAWPAEVATGALPAAAEVVVVGDELLSGDVLDVNTARLARRLGEVGVRVGRSTTVGDEESAIRSALVDAVGRRPRAVIVSGGLGPTSDDVTREALASLAGAPLRRDPGLEQGLADWYDGRGRELPDLARRQADVPVGARVLPNPAGTAPGLVLDVRGVPVYALPGVPHELAALVDRYLAVELADPTARPVVQTLRVVGLGESQIATRLAGVEASLPAGARLSYLPAGAQVVVRLTATGKAAATASSSADQIRALLGTAVVSAGETLEAVVIDRLRAAGSTVAVAESLTGGAVCATLIAVPGASAAVLGGVVAYSTSLKARLLGVPGDLLGRVGAVHPDVAAAMAGGVRDRLSSTYGLALTGVAGPDPQDGRPPGEVHLAVAGPAGTRLSSPHLVGDREQVRAASAVCALDLLRRCLEEGDESV